MWHHIIEIWNRLNAFKLWVKKRGMYVGTIICQDCNETIDQFENEKVTTLYGTCGHCHCCDEASE